MEERRGGGFRNRLAAANEATKNIKIKIRRGLKRLQNVEKNATINNKTSGIDGREKGWDESTMEGAGGARFGRLGGNRVGRGGET